MAVGVKHHHCTRSC